MLRLLSVEHRRQEEPMGCLAACAQMALHTIGVVRSQRQLNRLLGLTQIGVPALQIARLTRLGVAVLYEPGDEDAVRNAIDRGIPPIVFVLTGDLHYWNTSLRHAVIAVGYDDANVYVNDPAFSDAPKQVSWSEFLLAWSEFDYRYALLSPNST